MAGVTDTPRLIYTRTANNWNIFKDKYIHFNLHTTVKKINKKTKTEKKMCIDNLVKLRKLPINITGDMKWH